MHSKRADPAVRRSLRGTVPIFMLLGTVYDMKYAPPPPLHPPHCSCLLEI